MSDDCPICFEVIDNTQNMVITGCKHKFHTTCLLRSTQSSGYRCPNCRGSLLATDTASGPTGATGAAATRVAGPTGSASATGAATGPTAIRDISMNIIQGPNRTISEEMRRISEFQYYSTRVTYHNDSSDDESGVNGG
jgi:hypothetical protein